MDLTSLVDLTRSLAGDPSYEGNSTAWTPEEIVAALNWAQTRYAELTHCTYKEVAATAPTAADGIFTVPPGFILIDRVMVPDQATTGPNATIVGPAGNTVPAATTFPSGVPTQTGATYFWSVAGGSLVSGQGTPNVMIQAMSSVGGTTTLGCIVTLAGLRDTQSIDVVLT